MQNTLPRAQKTIFTKGGQQSPFLYVTEALKWPPVDGLTPNFVCTVHLGCLFLKYKFVQPLASKIQPLASIHHPGTFRRSYIG